MKILLILSLFLATFANAADRSGLWEGVLSHDDGSTTPVSFDINLYETFNGIHLIYRLTVGAAHLIGSAKDSMDEPLVVTPVDPNTPVETHNVLGIPGIRAFLTPADVTALGLPLTPGLRRYALWFSVIDATDTALNGGVYEWDSPSAELGNMIAPINLRFSHPTTNTLFTGHLTLAAPLTASDHSTYDVFTVFYPDYFFGMDMVPTPDNYYYSYGDYLSEFGSSGTFDEAGAFQITTGPMLWTDRTTSERSLLIGTRADRHITGSAESQSGNTLGTFDLIFN